jgi:Na+/H+-dicarboxylate symporter
MFGPLRSFAVFWSRWALNPYVVTASILAGGLAGHYFPEASKRMAFVGTLYVNLLTMIVLPFMVSAVMFSIRSLLATSASVGGLVRKIAVFYALAFLVTAAVGILSAQAVQPGAGVNEARLREFGVLVQADTRKETTDLEISLTGSAPPPQRATVAEFIQKLIPTNIFSALSEGNTLEVLVFALLFGTAVGLTPPKLSDSLAQALETVYVACQNLTRYFNVLLPLASFSLVAQQIAETGIGPLQVMLKFLLTFALAAGAVLTLSLLCMAWRSGKGLRQVMQANEPSFFMAVATRNSTACMPVMIEGLVQRLGFRRTESELLVPLGIALLRIGPVVYYTVAVSFIAQLYGHELTLGKLVLVLTVSILAGLASTGMTSVVAVAQTSVVCAYLGLPFEAAFVLFVAVDPVADILRTAMLVIGINAVTSLICERPQTDDAAPLSPPLHGATGIGGFAAPSGKLSGETP